MKKVTRKTWQAAIWKWEELSTNGGDESGWCAFCYIFRKGENSCPGCPLRLSSGGGCESSYHPWQAWSQSTNMRERKARAGILLAWIVYCYSKWEKGEKP